MKKLLIIILFSPFVLQAQETDRKIRFGMKVAPLFSWIKQDFDQNDANISDAYEVEGGGLRLGFNWGPQVEIILNETFLLSTGVDINYSTGRVKGRASRSLSPALSYNFDQLYKMRFIELPLMIKGRTKEIGHMRYFMSFGLSAGFRYKASTEFTEETNGSEITTPNTNSNTYINVFRGALLVGGGVEYNISGNTSLVASIMFNNGLTNILKDQQKVNPVTGENYPQDDFNFVREKGINNHLMLNVGILF
jgi:hypothetical protein